MENNTLKINGRNFKLIKGDCQYECPKLEENSVDLILTDVPYGLSFMGKHWDRGVPSKEVFLEFLRVLKPGAWFVTTMTPKQNLLSRLIVNLENAGFDVGFTSLYWTYSSGFPKAYDVSENHKSLEGAYGGFQPKPAVEVVVVAMKPLSERNYTEQALKNGKGITWLGKAKIPNTDLNTKEETRFPANLLVSDDALGNYSRFFSLESWAETLPFLAVPKASRSERNQGCEDLEDRFGGGMAGTLDKSLKTGSGNERNNVMKNNHPTAKPVKLFSYLLVLFSKQGDIVLDPYMGSGTTGIACVYNDRSFIGIELEDEYFEIADARVRDKVPFWDM